MDTRQQPESIGNHAAIGGSWTHRLARPLIRPLVGTPVKPNHITTLRVISALGACAALAVGNRSGEIWGGAIWILSAFLDRADGELARISGQTSDWGHTYDYWSDVSSNALFFVAIGIGLRGSVLGWWAIPMGLISGAAVATTSILAEQLEQRDSSGKKAFSGFGGFDADDVFYLFGPVAWLGWLLPVLVGTPVAATFAAILTWWRLQQMPKPSSPQH
jgi:archaetidylinositol phosphate synthase